MQREGIDFNKDETYQPIAKHSTLRTSLSLAARNNWEIHQIDVKSAYLHGKLKEKIYMRQPPGFIVVGKELMVCQLDKWLYGLRQSGGEWYKKHSSGMKALNFKKCTVDHACWWKIEDSKKIIVAKSVDNMALFVSSISILNKFKADYNRIFPITDLGEIHWLLGIGVTCNRKKVLCRYHRNPILIRLLKDSILKMQKNMTHLYHLVKS